MVLDIPVKPDYEAFLACLRREGTPERVHLAELFLDREMKQAVVDRFALDEGLDRDDPHFEHQLEIRIQRHLGYDYVTTNIENFEWQLTQTRIADTVEDRQRRDDGRQWMEGHRGPIASWEDFEA